MMDTPDSTLERLFADKPPAPKLVVQRELPATGSEARVQPPTDSEPDDDQEPDFYRPYLRKPHPLVAFLLIEKNGTMHSFQYHTLRHPKWRVIEGVEFLSFAADGMAIVLEGRGLAVILRALNQQRLAEVREYDERPGTENISLVCHLEVRDPHAQQA